MDFHVSSNLLCLSRTSCFTCSLPTGVTRPPDPDADGDLVMDIGGNNAKEWAPFPLVSQLGSDIDGILNDKSENIGGDNEHILDKEDFFGNTIYIKF